MTPLPAISALLVGLSLASCNFAPRYLMPSPELPATFKTSGPWRTAQPRDQASRGNWWGAFADARLARLLQQTQDNSPRLDVALARVHEARSEARADRSNLFPFLTLNGGANRDRASGTMQAQFAGGRTRTTLRSTLDFDYELDLWGKLRNQARSGNAQAQSIEADYHSVLLGLQSELALNYYALQAQDAEIAVLRRSVELRKKNVDLARTRFKQGDTAQIDVAQAETELAATESEAIGLEQKRAELEHAIALLLGTTPSEFSLPPMPLNGSPPSIPASVPSDLLERRPDVASAERQMASLNAEIGVARAALFPSVRMGASGGTSSSYTNLLAKRASRVWGLGPDIEWPIFQAGKRMADIDASKARYDGAAASYRQTVLKAVSEVEDALSGLDVLKRQAAKQATTVASARSALDLSQKRYESGLVAYYEVLDAQRTLLNAERDFTRLKGQQHVSTVLLIKALGGGW